MTWAKDDQYFDSIDSVPNMYKKAKAFQLPNCWSVKSDDVTGLPLWSNVALALHLWEEPPCLKQTDVPPQEVAQPKSESKEKEKPMEKEEKAYKKLKFSAEAGIPGAWQTVQEGEPSVFGDNVGLSEGVYGSNPIDRTSAKIDDFLGKRSALKFSKHIHFQSLPTNVLIAVGML